MAMREACPSRTEPSTSFCPLAIHNIEDAGERATAIREMVRVLAPGGYVGIIDIKNDYSSLLESAGAPSIRKRWSLLFALITRTVTARKTLSPQG